MIEFYTWQTSNGLRVAITLEECGLAYRVHPVDLRNGEQRRPEFLALNPAGAVPVIVDPQGPGGAPLTLSQSAAIVLYLAEKSGRYIPRDPARRVAMLQWLAYTIADCAAANMAMFLLSGLAPEQSPANVAFFEERLLRYFRVVDQHLAQREWLADELSVADFSLYPLYAVRKGIVDAAGDLLHLTRWGVSLAARPAVERAMRTAS
jgi:GST-like protein